MEISVGTIARSKAGRDKGGRFVVLALEGEYAYLADGDLRKTERPKKKKLKHLQGSKTICRTIAEKLGAGGCVTNSEVRKALAETIGSIGSDLGGNNIG
ncbi:MAG TPA: KOW domain-containing RNA-binding protein [Candidatus Ornithomonoglobus intestinigallinarum]|uniref:KOW domain-containing RNA-binding protein n=1 Tax=Candidatus Ornithomonoglobus intestinigallinarum TaxID=2840894 RepID=A0A9D1KQ56_9FIRM|nr:KOW domain-containing RNA-binding protein [Candidatus Ornithomonoglobus intestinigallinarum]